LLLLLSFLDAALGVLLLPLLLFIVFGDALLDVGLQVAAQEDWQLSQFERHLVVVVSLRVLLHDRDDALRLRRRERVDLANQVVALLDRQRLLIQILRGLLHLLLHRHAAARPFV